MTALSAPAKKREDIRGMLSIAMDRGACDGLPKHIKPDAMVSAITGSLTRDPGLLDCKPATFVRALVLASQAGLPPDGYHAHLVRYKDEVEYIPDFKGLIQIALRNGCLIDAHPVYEKDRFEYTYGLEPTLVHVPYEGDDAGPLRAAYAVARFSGPDGDKTVFVVASKRDVERRKAASKSAAYGGSPWKKWEPEMWVKTAVKMLSKYIPRSEMFTMAVRADDFADSGSAQIVSDNQVLEFIDDGDSSRVAKVEAMLTEGTEDDASGTGT